MRSAFVLVVQEAAELACLGAFLAAILLLADHIEATAILGALV